MQRPDIIYTVTERDKWRIYGNIAQLCFSAFMLGGLLEGGPTTPRLSLYTVLLMVNTLVITWRVVKG